MTRQTNRYYKLKAEGKCVQCARDRGEDGTIAYCRSCADKLITNGYYKLRAEGKCVRCRQNRGENGTTIHCRSCADKVSNVQRKRRQKLVNAGLCIVCNNPRGKEGTASHCRKCANKSNNRTQQWSGRKKVLGLCILCGQREAVDGNHCEVCRRRSMLRGAKRRAKRKEVPFNLTVEDVDWVDTCPILGIPLVHNKGKLNDNSPSLDRLIPELGYVKGNVCVISMKANGIKSNATAEEIYKVAAWLKERT